MSCSNKITSIPHIPCKDVRIEKSIKFEGLKCYLDGNYFGEVMGINENIIEVKSENGEIHIFEIIKN